MKLSRRDWLKAAGTTAGLALVSPFKFVASQSSASDAGSLSDVAMLIDVSKCIGCWWCYAACKNYNNLPETLKPEIDNPPELSEHTWTTLFTVNKGDNKWSARKHACMHCTEASCEQVCPTGAISHKGAVVIIDQEWCIGCGYCAQACPFGVPHKDEHVGTARKCEFCIDRISNGEIPACADACPEEAIQFGERNSLLTVAKTQVEYLKANGYPKANLYGEHESGGLHVLYVLDDEPEVYGLPGEVRIATSQAWTKWLSGVIAGIMLATIPFWIVFKRKRAQKKSSDSE